MIRLRKLPEPAVLQTNSAEWLKVIEDKLAAGLVPTDAEKSRYRHPEIKAVLVTETSGKCAYCESKLLHIAYGDVEHISPKSLKLSDIFRWENLTLACDRCNTNKGNEIDIVDPYVDDPTVLFRFLGPFISPVTNERRAVISTKVLQLNRADLILYRTRRLETISNILLTIVETKDDRLRDIIIRDLIDNEMSDNSEYAAAVRGLIRVAGADIRPLAAAVARS